MKETNTSRQYHLDLLKALGIVSMIICHCVISLGAHHEGYENDFWYWFADIVLGDYIAVAHAFMFAMGVGFVYTKKKRPVDLVTRGVKIFLLGYVLNFLRYGGYALIDGLMEGRFEPQTLEALFGPDILQFAGLAMILTGIFKRLGLGTIPVFVISILMSAAGSFLVLIDTGNYMGNLLLGQLITTTTDTSCFALLNWYLFVASGMLFGKIIRGLTEQESFYQKLLILSGLLSLVYLILTFRFGALFLTRQGFYYSIGTLDAAGLICTDLFLLSVFYFLLKKTGPDRFQRCIEMSKNLTAIYVIHWCIIGFVDSIFCFLLEISFPYYVIYPLAIELIPVSFRAARAWNSRTKKVREQTEAYS